MKIMFTNPSKTFGKFIANFRSNSWPVTVSKEARTHVDFMHPSQGPSLDIVKYSYRRYC